MRDDDRPGPDSPGLDPVGSTASGAAPFLPDSPHEEPLDLAALFADDELIEALVGGRASRPATADAAGHGGVIDDELSAMLAAWVSEVRPESVADERLPPVAVSARHQVPGQQVPRQHVARQHEMVAPVAARHRPTPVLDYGRRVMVAATVILLAASGLAVGAWESHPGQPLFSVTRVVFGERAASLEAAADVDSHLAAARSAIGRGDTRAAVAALTVANARLGAVGTEEGHDELAQVQAELVSKMPPGALPAAVAPASRADVLPFAAGAATDRRTGPPGDRPAAAAVASTAAPLPPGTEDTPPSVEPASPTTVTTEPAAPETPVADTPTPQHPAPDSPAPDTPAPAEPTTADQAPPSTEAPTGSDSPGTEPTADVATVDSSPDTASSDGGTADSYVAPAATSEAVATADEESSDDGGDGSDPVQ